MIQLAGGMLLAATGVFESGKSALTACSVSVASQWPLAVLTLPAGQNEFGALMKKT